MSPFIIQSEKTMANTTTNPTHIRSLIESQRRFFETQASRPYEFRKQALQKLERLLREHEEELIEALRLDLGKPRSEALASEVDFVGQEIRYALKNLKRWMRPKKVGTPLFAWKAESRIYAEAHGNTLVIGPWNYPLQLLLTPVIGAIAGGNTVILKPSEIASHTAQAVARMMSSFQPEYIAAVQGGVAVSEALLAERFNFIFFTGSTEVGRIVMSAAAKHLTPVVLELGGKSPCLIDQSAPLAITARRIVWGKFYNSGQSCVAPDYLLVHRSIKDVLVAELKKTILSFYGADPKKSADYGRIINSRNFDRLRSLIVPGEGKVVHGGNFDETERYFAPTLVDDSHISHKLMAEEIFGPILPILTYDTIEDAVAIMRARPEPLSLYVFSRDNRFSEKIIRETRFGGGCVNDTFFHLANHELPFGGVGQSGIGAYHGRHSFDVFTHKKGVIHRSLALDPALRYPPVSKFGTSVLRWLMS